MISQGMESDFLRRETVSPIAFSSCRAGMTMESILPIAFCELRGERADAEEKSDDNGDASHDLQLPRDVRENVAKIVADEHDDEYPHDAAQYVDRYVTHERNAHHAGGHQRSHRKPESHREFRDHQYSRVVAMESAFNLLDDFRTRAKEMPPARDERPRAEVADEVPHHVGEKI